MLTRDAFQTLYDQGPDAVFALIHAFQHQIAVSQEQSAALSARIKVLEDRLATDSHNSSKPPSSDALAKKPVSLRAPSGRKAGGQKGHPGRTLLFCDSPDQIILHAPERCAACGSGLAGVEAAHTQSRQVVDVPPLALVTTEHRVATKVCVGCGHATAAAFPAGVTEPVGYGARLKALGLYLRDFQLLPYARIAALLTDLLGASVSEGTLFACEQSAARPLTGVLDGIRAGLQNAAVAHFDETGLRVEGRLHWLHSASTKTLTSYSVHAKRGQAGMDAAGILPHFDGIAVHDGWRCYRHYEGGHALCNAHHLRELTAVQEQDGQAWAQAMAALLVEIKRTVQTATGQKRVCLSADEQTAFRVRYRQLLCAGYAANPPPSATGKRGKPKQSRARNLLDRLQEYEADTLRFMVDFAVPFDNNLAERDIRMVKVQQKVSGAFRSLAGAEAFCAIRSYISTLRKQGRSLLPALEHVFAGSPLHPQI